MATRKESVDELRVRYGGAAIGERIKILDAFVALTGYYRKHAIRALSAQGWRVGTAAAFDAACGVAVPSVPTAAQRRFQLLTVATGTSNWRAALWPPIDSASLIALILNSSVYCRLGRLLSCIANLRTGEVSNFLLYVKSRQGYGARKQ